MANGKETAPVAEKQPEVVVATQPQPPVRPEPEKVLLEWKAPVRPFKRRSRHFWTTAFMMAFLVGVIMFFVEGWMPVAVIVAFLFLVYVMSSVPPEEANFQVTTQGIKIGEAKYFWGECVRFWFSERWGQKLLNVDIVRLPGRISILLGDVKESQLRDVVSKYLVYEVARPSWVERASDWLGKTIPLEVD